MPESRHRRKGKVRPRPQEVIGPPVKAKPSPRWVPIVGITLIGVGVLAILVNYIPGLFEQNWVLLAGFGLLAAGFLFLSRWR